MENLMSTDTRVRGFIQRYLLVLFLVNMTLVYAGKGTLRIASDMKDAYVYIDDSKRAMIGEGYTTLLLEEGEYMVKVEKTSDDNATIYRQSKKVFIGADVSVKFRFELLALASEEIALFESYKAGCNDENISKCLDLGYMYEKGQGVEENKREAFLLYEKSCKAKNYLGCSNLGYMYENAYGIEQNTSKALELYQASCENNNTLGCLNYGILGEKFL
jgi:TPR repeat protein